MSRKIGSRPDAPKSIPATEKPDALPATLGDYVAKYHNREGAFAKLAKDPLAITSAANTLLQARGIDDPTQSQIDETAFQLDKAIKSGNWHDFSAPFDPGIVKVEDGVNQRLGNVFFEKKVFSAEQLEWRRFKLTDSDSSKFKHDYESGCRGMILAASFIQTRHRAEGDFTRAYGDQAWRGFVRATTFLDSIPKGKFLESLDIEQLRKIHEFVFAPDDGIKTKLARAVTMVGHGCRRDKGGEIRD